MKTWWKAKPNFLQMQNVLCILQNRESVDNCIMRLNIYSTEIFWLIFVCRQNEKPSCFTLCFDLLPKPQLAELNTMCNILKQYVIFLLQKQLPEVFWKILQNSQENTCARVSCLIKLQAWQLYLKWDSVTSAFLWILQNF